LLLESPPNYIYFTGQDGLRLDISLPSEGPFDYTLMFWFRSVRSYNELSLDEQIKGGKKAYLFEIPGYDEKTNKYHSANKESGVACFITDPGNNEPILCCSNEESESDFRIDLKDLPDI